MPLKKHFLLGRCIKQLRGRCFNFNCSSAVVVNSNFRTKAEVVRFSKKLLKWIPNDAYGYSHFLHCAFFLSCVIFTHTSAVMYKILQVFREIGKLLLSPQRAWRHAYWKERSDSLWRIPIWRIFYQLLGFSISLEGLRSKEVIKASVKENRWKKSSNLSSFHFFFLYFRNV